MAKDIPYLEPAEECEEIFYDDCQEVGGKIKEISHFLKKWIIIQTTKNRKFRLEKNPMVLIEFNYIVNDFYFTFLMQS